MGWGRYGYLRRGRPRRAEELARFQLIEFRGDRPPRSTKHSVRHKRQFSLLNRCGSPGMKQPAPAARAPGSPHDAATHYAATEHTGETGSDGSGAENVPEARSGRMVLSSSQIHRSPRSPRREDTHTTLPTRSARVPHRNHVWSGRSSILRPRSRGTRPAPRTALPRPSRSPGTASAGRSDVSEN